MKFLLAIFLATSPVLALEAISVGGQLGNVGLSASTATTHSNSIGFGIDVSLKTGSQIELVLLLLQSGHTSATLPGLTQWTGGFSADVHLFRIQDFEFIVGLGPALTFFQGAQLLTKFDIHGGVSGDLWIEDRFRLGLGFRYFGVLNGSTTGDSFWMVSMRLGYQFLL